MAKYCISEEGAQAMENLGIQLLKNANAISEASSSLSLKIEEADGSENDLGIYYDEILSLIDRSLQIIDDNMEDLEGLGKKTKEQAEMIRELVNNGFGISDPQPSGGRNGSENADWEPRVLDETEYGYEEDDDGYLVYDSPQETYDNLLWQRQGNNDLEFRGTCGLCSCVNILRLAGRKWTSEDEVVKHAVAEGLCTTGYPDNDMNGGVSTEDMRQILKNFNLESETFSPVFSSGWDINYDATIKMIADFVENGRGVILSVNAYTLWYGKVNNGNSAHAIVVISVKKDDEGNIVEFFICDTGSGKGKWYSVDKIAKSLLACPMNVTGILR